ncbi:H25N7.03 protein, partial [Aphelenchoides avenae]
VLTLIHEGLEYKAVNANLNANDQTTDALHTVIHVSRKEHNFDPRDWPSSFNTLICGDVNGHSPQWDANCDEEDAIGQLVADWMLDWSFMPANTGEATRYAHDGHGTAPDVTLHRTADMRKVHWHIGEDLGSDHMPIIIDYRVSRSIPPATRRTFWNTRKADWSAYRRLIDERLSTWTCRDEQLAAKNVEFVKAVISAAEASIPRGSRKDYKPFWTAELEAAVRERNRVRRLCVTVMRRMNILLLLGGYAS